MTKRFQGEIYRVGQLRCVDVPPAVVKALGGGKRIPVVVKLGAREAQTALVPTKEGGHRVFLDSALRRAAAVDSGDRVRIEVRPDAKGGEPDLPEDLLAALSRTPGALEALMERSPADRRSLVKWIEEPRSPESRRHRIAKAIVRIRKGPPKRAR